MTPKTSRRKRVPDAQRHTVPGPKPYTPSVEHIESNDNTSEPTVRQTILFSICSQLGRTSVKRSFWAFCQIADVERLSFIARQDSFIIEYIEQQCEATIPQWCQQERSSRVSDVGSSNSSWSRNYRDIKDAKERDGNHCLFTNVTGASINVCHIYPYYALKRVGGPIGFWSNLAMFWSQEKVKRWQDAIYTDGHADGCHNMLTMQNNLHANWNSGAFALKPLPLNMNVTEEREARALRIQFFWQPFYDKDKERSPEVDLLEQPRLAETSQHNTFTEDWRVQVQGRVIDKREIVNGMVFIVSTHDPLRLPLPSRDLLEMQWNLNRVVALRGAAENVNDDQHPDEGDTKGLVPSTQYFAMDHWLNSHEIGVSPLISSH